MQSNEPSKEIVSKKPEEEDNEDVDSEEEESHSESEQKVVKRQEESGGEGQEDDEEQWAKYQEEAKKEQQLDTKAKESHPVHCPYFPEVRGRVKHFSKKFSRSGWGIECYPFPTFCPSGFSMLIISVTHGHIQLKFRI